MERSCVLVRGTARGSRRRCTVALVPPPPWAQACNRTRRSCGPSKPERVAVELQLGKRARFVDAARGDLQNDSALSATAHNVNKKLRARSLQRISAAAAHLHSWASSL